MYKPKIEYTGPFPKHYHRNCKKWITEQLVRVSLGHRERAAREYSKLWITTYNECENPIERDCRAMNAANSRLRVYIERVEESLMGKTSPPPLEQRY